MAVQEATHPTGAASVDSPISTWGGVISKLIFVLIGLLVVSIVVLVVSNRKSEASHLKDRESWDEVYTTLKEAKSQKERVAALEGLWDKASTSSAHPYVMLQLGQAQFMMGISEERPIGDRKKSLERARQVFDLLREREGKHALYGALAAEGSAVCREQDGDIDGAMQVLTDAVSRYETHFLHSKLCYQLGRLYWLRSLKSNSADDRKEALRWVEKALQDAQENPQGGNKWREEAQFIKSVLGKHGPAWPDNEPPPAKPAPAPVAEKTPAAEKTTGEAAKSPAPVAPKVEVEKK